MAETRCHWCFPCDIYTTHEFIGISGPCTIDAYLPITGRRITEYPNSQILVYIERNPLIAVSRNNAANA